MSNLLGRFMIWLFVGFIKLDDAGAADDNNDDGEGNVPDDGWAVDEIESFISLFEVMAV